MAVSGVTDPDDITNKGFLAAAIVITALNAAFVMFAYFLWNMGLGKDKFKEMWRSVKEFKAASKYYFFGAICGGPLAILGSFIAMGYIGAAFAAVAALAYPVIGSLLSRTWLGQKISHRAMAGLLIILIGSITIFAFAMMEELGKGGSMIGVIGGIMALCGWGVEGVVAARGIDVSEPDIAITMRFGFESLIWWIVAIPALIILLGTQTLTFIGQLIGDPIILLSFVMLGLTFGFCYVTWYKSFPLIGVGRGQAIGSLYALCSVVFLVLFIGVYDTFNSDDSIYISSLVIGAIICTIGTIIMFTEKPEQVECLRDRGNTGEDES
jgi:drug/metabolite transporter (DMT)-like permease